VKTASAVFKEMKNVNKVTLGLNMIVGGGESLLLARCLDSVNAGSTFDEIVIVNTSNDVAIDKVADTYGARLLRREWVSSNYPYGDFAGARNDALAGSSTDYIMWLDSDDVIADGCRDSLGSMKAFVTDQANSHIDIFNIPYILTIDESNDVEYSLLRDRIFRRGQNISWENPVHESLSAQWDILKQHNYVDIEVVHIPEKRDKASARRNIRILRHELENKAVRSFHNRYFLARDLLCDNQCDEASAIINALVSEHGHDPQTLYTLCMEAAFQYAYSGRKLRPGLRDLDITQAEVLERWLKQAIGYTRLFAEPFFLLGELYLGTGRRQLAEQMYTQALNKTVVRHTLQLVPYYRELPGHRLAEMFLEQGQLEKALWANRTALLQIRGSTMLREQRKAILSALLEEDL